MAFRTRRQNRYLKLRTNGFLPFEARALSKVPIKGVPYMKEVINARRELLTKATEDKLSAKEYERKIKQIYIDNAFTKAGAKRIEYSPWKMLRKAEDAFKVKHPEYESPWKKRRQGWMDFLAKAERTIEKQQEGKK